MGPRPVDKFSSMAGALPTTGLASCPLGPASGEAALWADALALHLVALGARGPALAGGGRSPGELWRRWELELGLYDSPRASHLVPSPAQLQQVGVDSRANKIGGSCLWFVYLFIYIWLCWVFIAVPGLFSSCSEWGLLFVVVRGLLIAVASLVAEHGL